MESWKAFMEEKYNKSVHKKEGEESSRKASFTEEKYGSPVHKKKVDVLVTHQLAATEEYYGDRLVATEEYYGDRLVATEEDCVFVDKKEGGLDESSGSSGPNTIPYTSA
eukprot:810963-Prorocentrum_minimum.AAC.1